MPVTDKTGKPVYTGMYATVGVSVLSINEERDTAIVQVDTSSVTNEPRPTFEVKARDLEASGC